MLELRFIRDHVEEVRAGAESQRNDVDLKRSSSSNRQRRALILRRYAQSSATRSPDRWKIKHEGGDASPLLQRWTP